MVNLGRAYHRQTYWYLPLLSELQTTRELYKQIYLRESYNQKGFLSEIGVTLAGLHG